jgi:hypothetical protein
VIQHLPFTTPAQGISVGLALMLLASNKCLKLSQSPAEGSSIVNLPLFLITLPRMSKPQEIFE